MHGLSLLVFPGREESIRIEDMLRRVLRESQILREEKGSISHNMFTLKVINNTGFPVGLVVKNPPANAEDEGLIPGLGRSPGEGKGSPLQCSCLGNSMGRGAWRATSTGSPLGMHACVVIQSCPTLATPWTVAHQAPLSMELSKQEYWSG